MVILLLIFLAILGVGYAIHYNSELNCELKEDEKSEDEK